VLPVELQYACRNWIDHLRILLLLIIQDGSPRLFRNLRDKICVLLKMHLLHWIEAVSLLRLFTEGIRSVKALRSVLLEMVSTYIPALEIGIMKSASTDCFCHSTVRIARYTRLYIIRSDSF